MQPETMPSLGRIAVGEIVKLVRLAHDNQWSGVIRARSQGRIGALWFVRGEVAHAVTVEGQQGTRGPVAIQAMVTWVEGNYFLEDSALPPDRTVRMTTDELLASLEGNHCPDSSEHTERTRDPAARLEDVLQRLRNRSPEIEGVGVADDQGMRQLSPCHHSERKWIEERVRLMTGEVGDSEILVRERERTVLLIKRNNRVAVVFAGSNASAENMLWAGEQTRRWILESPAECEGGAV